ncbi:urea ABC transporter permease subunit UrtB [soil metagenome]
MMRSLRFLLPIIFAVCALVAGAGMSHAAPLDDALALFAEDSYSDTATAIDGIVASGSPRAGAIIAAAKDETLFFDPATKKVYIKAGAALTDAVTGAAVPGDPPADLMPVRLNNRLRNVVNAALGGLTLMSPNRADRLSAAQEVLRSHDAAVLPLLATAIDKEIDPTVKQELREAQAAVLLAQDETSEADKLAAVETIRVRGDQDALALLTTLPDSMPQSVKDAAAAAAASIRNGLALWNVVQNAWYGLSLGSVLLLAAIGLAITFGVMGVINMAHGEMVMLGAYTAFVVQETIRDKALSLFIPFTSIGVTIPIPNIPLDLSLIIALPLAFVVAGIVGIVIERGIIRFLYGRPLETLLATWGLSLVLQQSVRTLFGPNNRLVETPSWMSGATKVGGLVITYNRLWIIVFSFTVFAVLLLVLRFTRFGLQMRAVTQNRDMAAAMGIRTPWVDALTFGLGCGIAGIAGIALSQIDNVSPNLGRGYIIDSFMVVVFGGVGNLWGTLVGALSLGIANKFLEPFAGAVLGKIAVFVFIILFIQRRPRGLFALKGRAVEA